jgi:hypothetical protein
VALCGIARAQAFNVGRGLQIKPGTVKPIASSGYGILWISSADSKVYYTNASGTSTALSTLALTDLGGLTLSAYRIYKTGSAANYINWDLADNVQLKTAACDLKVSTGVYMGCSVLNASNVTYDIGSIAYRFRLGYMRAIAVGDVAANKPTCNSDNRGMIWVNYATGGNSDTVEVCVKAAADTYAYLVIGTAP